MAGVNPRSLNVIHAYKNINVFIMKKGQGRSGSFLRNRSLLCPYMQTKESAHTIFEKKKGQCAENTGGLCRSKI
jgi:hypothetical protein